MISVDHNYLIRHHPEYMLAFDYAADRINKNEGNKLCHISSPLFILELIWRCTKPLYLSFDSFQKHENLEQDIKNYARHPITICDLNTIDDNLDAILWAEPDAISAERNIAKFSTLSRKGTSLNIIVSGPLRKYLPLWNSPTPPTIQPVNPGKVFRLLSNNNWRIVKCISFHGPQSMFYSSLSRFFFSIGNPALGDRCIYTMRKHYQNSCQVWPFSTLTWIQAVKNDR